MRCKWFIMLALVCILGVFFIGCNQEQDPGQAQGKKEELILVDHMDRELKLGEVANRIVSFMPSTTEMIYALEIEDKLVGVTDYCNYPSEATQKASVGSFTDPNIEKVVALEPDLVLVGSQHREELEKLEEMGVSYLALMPETFEEIYDSIELIASAAGAAAEGEILVEDMQAQIEEVKEKIDSVSENDKVRVYYELYADPLMSVGNNAVIHEIITYAGGKNIFSDLEDNYPQVSKEVVVERDPEVILFPEDHGTEIHVAEKLKERSAWEQISAIKNDRLHAVNADMFSRPVPRVAQAVEEAANLFHPEVFE